MATKSTSRSDVKMSMQSAVATSLHQPEVIWTRHMHANLYRIWNLSPVLPW